MDGIEADPSVGAIVVTGAPPAFCAGADLGNLAEVDGERLGAIYEGFLRIARSSLPTLAAVNGAAVGAGMNLALGCDVRLAARRARFDTRFLQLGLHPGGGHTWMLRRSPGCRRRWPPSCSATCSTARRPSVSASPTAASTTTSCSRRPTTMAARAASVPRELVIATKQTIEAMADRRRPSRRGADRARPAAVEHAPALVRRAHRRDAGQDQSRPVTMCHEPAYPSCPERARLSLRGRATFRTRIGGAGAMVNATARPDTALGKPGVTRR